MKGELTRKESQEVQFHMLCGALGYGKEKLYLTSPEFHKFVQDWATRAIFAMETYATIAKILQEQRSKELHEVIKSGPSEGKAYV